MDYQNIRNIEKLINFLEDNLMCPFYEIDMITIATKEQWYENDTSQLIGNREIDGKTCRVYRGEAHYVLQPYETKTGRTKKLPFTVETICDENGSTIEETFTF